jgi:hypothetical protein
MAEADENSSHSHSQGVDTDFSIELIRTIIAADTVQTGSVSTDTKTSPHNRVKNIRVSFKNSASFTGNVLSNVQKPEDGDLLVTRHSPSKKCHGTTHLSSPSRNSEADGKKSLVELRRVTKFPMVRPSHSTSTPTSFSTSPKLTLRATRLKLLNSAPTCLGQLLPEKIETTKTRLDLELPASRRHRQHTFFLIFTF